MNASLLLVASACLAGAASLSGQAPSPSATPPVPGSLRLDMVVVDRKGAPVTDIKPSEIEVWISGYRVPVTDVFAVTPASGRTVVLLLDNAAVGPALVPRIKEAARQFVEKMGPGDRTAVVTLNRGTLQLTSDRNSLLAAIDKYYAQSFPIRPDDTAADVLRTIELLARNMTEGSDGRKAIVAIGAGWLFDTPMPPPTSSTRDLQQEWVAAMRSMAAANASLYVIDPVGVGAVRGADGGRSGFARETGGHAFLSVNDTSAAVNRIWDESGTYYMLAMKNPPVQQKAELREVDVKVHREGVTVRARKGIRGR
jgi:VWFA-related protein